MCWESEKAVLDVVDVDVDSSHLLLFLLLLFLFGCHRGFVVRFSACLLRQKCELISRPRFLSVSKKRVSGSVGDPDPEPDPDIFGPPASGSVSISQRKGSESVSGSFPFLINVLSGLK
jgi:hypothetical protein